MDDKKGLKDESTTSKGTRTPKKSKQSTQAEVDLRVSEIQSLILQGYTRAYLLQYGSKWVISDRQIDDYISKATTAIKEINQASVQDNMAIITSNLWDAFRTAKQEKNLSEQHKILMSIAKLKGLDQMTVNHIIEDKRDLESLTDEELGRILEGTNEPAQH